MSDLWWTSPNWKNTQCERCGKNIWASGGDPDWGLCYECFEDERFQRLEEPEPALPLCEICEKATAITDVNGYVVCSKECAEIAAKREPKSETVKEKQ